MVHHGITMKTTHTVLGKRGKVLGNGTIKTKRVGADLHDGYYQQDLLDNEGETIATRTAEDRSFTVKVEGWIYVGVEHFKTHDCKRVDVLEDFGLPVWGA